MSVPHSTHENRLARETSPYLLQHKTNPVDWWPWGPPALAEARHTGKPILLSVGYSACHWCHVMAHESPTPGAGGPGGPPPFAEARHPGKPILLSVGYSACHWCHVMAHESFEDPAIARLMNEMFVNVKVDREERPDIDAVCMEACQSMTGQGGWPLNCFLTPDQAPFFAGTYFPPQPRQGMPSWRQV